jgi:uncharacterized protein
MLQRALVLSAFLSAAHPGFAQSFDCAKAQTRVEKMVCADRGIADLDAYLGRYYSAAREAMPGAASCLQADQSQWLKRIRASHAGGTGRAGCQVTHQIE